MDQDHCLHMVRLHMVQCSRLNSQSHLEQVSLSSWFGRHQKRPFFFVFLPLP